MMKIVMKGHENDEKPTIDHVNRKHDLIYRALEELCWKRKGGKKERKKKKVKKCSPLIDSICIESIANIC